MPHVLEELDRRRPEGLVLKPVGGGQGKELLILDAIDYATGRAVTRAGAETTLEAALAGVDLGAPLPNGIPGRDVRRRAVSRTRALLAR